MNPFMLLIPRLWSAEQALQAVRLLRGVSTRQTASPASIARA